jgi:hypothetical protein
MPGAASIHIGVNRPHGRLEGYPLRQCEDLAWRIASLAQQAGYDSTLVLRGPAATRKAVHDALTAAAGAMAKGDVLLVTFCGHGSQARDTTGDDEGGCDETWCLHDGEILDDQLAGYWRLFQPGVRIVVVADSCHGGGVAREDPYPALPCMSAPPALVYRTSAGAPLTAADYAASCIAEPPRVTDGIHASVLLLAAAGKHQKAQEGLYTYHLLRLWEGGVFPGSYCDLHRRVRESVMTERGRQEPQILMLGSPDRDFPLQRAFHVARPEPPDPTRVAHVYRDGVRRGG